MFADDVRLPCKFEINSNLIDWVFDEMGYDWELGDDLSLRIANQCEVLIHRRLCRGEKVNIFVVVETVIRQHVHA